MRLNISRADPAGNITIFVLDEVSPSLRADISSKLMAIEQFGAEQVGFLTAPHDPSCTCRLEMMGGEFCGNASRSLGLYLADKSGKSGSFKIEVSGCERPITVSADPEKGVAYAEMPLPKSVCPFVLAGIDCLRVDFDGISHLVADCPQPDHRLINAAGALFEDDDAVSAYGVIFLDSAAVKMIPAVYVKATQSLVWEGSCGSGSVAAAVALSTGFADGQRDFSIGQPKGELEVSIKKQNGRVIFAQMGGAVSIKPPVSIEI